MQPENNDQQNPPAQPGQAITPSLSEKIAKPTPSTQVSTGLQNPEVNSTQPIIGSVSGPSQNTFNNQSVQGQVQPTNPNSKKKLFLLGGLAVLIIAVAVAAFLIMSPSSKKSNNATKTAKSSIGTGSSSSVSSNSTTPTSNPNQLRTGDAEGIAGAAWEHLIRATPSTLPHSLFNDTDNTLDICGSATCTSSTSPSGSAVLEYYKTSAVSIKSSTGPGMTVPDANTVYIVDNALCNSTDTGLGQIAQSDIGKVFAVLYALDASAGPQQKCVDSNHAQ